MLQSQGRLMGSLVESHCLGDGGWRVGKWDKEEKKETDSWRERNSNGISPPWGGGRWTERRRVRKKARKTGAEIGGDREFKRKTWNRTWRNEAGRRGELEWRTRCSFTRWCHDGMCRWLAIMSTKNEDKMNSPGGTEDNRRYSWSEKYEKKSWMLKYTMEVCVWEEGS